MNYISDKTVAFIVFFVGGLISKFMGKHQLSHVGGGEQQSSPCTKIMNYSPQISCLWGNLENPPCTYPQQKWNVLDGIIQQYPDNAKMYLQLTQVL